MTRPSPRRTDRSTLATVSMLGAGVGILFVLGPASAQQSQQPPTHETGHASGHDHGRSPVHRGPVAPPDPVGEAGGGGGGPMSQPHFPAHIRSIDGTQNNLDHPTWGATGIMLIRLTPADYADGASLPAGGNRLSARAVSNLVAAQDQDVPNTMNASDYLWQWGQFIDHDIDETPVADPAEAFDITVPAFDPWFDPTGDGDRTIALNRSAWQMSSGARQQLNNITAFIDASNVYGSDEERADALRAHDGTGRLKTSDGDLLPFNDAMLDNAPTAFDPSFFLAGDIRANEQAALTAMHTLFVREHNYWAGRIAAIEPQLDGDALYEHARAIVAAEMQAITYREFLPVLLGPNPLPPYQGHREQVNPGICNVFATAAYRVGHTMLSPYLLRLDADGSAADEGHLALASAFFTPSIIQDNGIDSLLRGMARQQAQQVDTLIIDDVRNFLFGGGPGSPGFDLAALNIQRGRDHGLPGYNQVRTAFGRPPANGFNQITPDPQVRAALEQAYGSPQQVDAWIGLLAEPHRPGAVVGETLHRVLRDQFLRLRDGDRFWYQGYLPPDMVQLVEAQTLSRIIRRNTAVTTEIQRDVFHVNTPCLADFNRDGMVAVGDLVAVISAWGVCDICPEDVDATGLVDVTDLVEVISAWGACGP